MILPDFSNREPKGLYEPIAYALAAGGKRLRPQLAILGAQVFGANKRLLCLPLKRWKCFIILRCYMTT